MGGTNKGVSASSFCVAALLYLACVCRVLPWSGGLREPQPPRLHSGQQEGGSGGRGKALSFKEAAGSEQRLRSGGLSLLLGMPSSVLLSFPVGHTVTLNRTERGRDRHFGRQIVVCAPCLAHGRLSLENLTS